MDDHAHHRDHRAAALAAVVTALATLLVAVCFVIFTIWVVMAEQKTKLYEADNVVCASQPFSIQCFERKAR